MNISFFCHYLLFLSIKVNLIEIFRKLFKNIFIYLFSKCHIFMKTDREEYIWRNIDRYYLDKVFLQLCRFLQYCDIDSIRSFSLLVLLAYFCNSNKYCSFSLLDPLLFGDFASFIYCSLSK